MRCIPILLAAALLAFGPAAPAQAQAQNRNDQASARQEMRNGKVLPSREIERRIIPQMKGREYLGFEYDGAAQAYRLKFIRDARVIWVDVDARTGAILRVSR